MKSKKQHILICTTSYPDPTLNTGQEAAGAFVADFANALSEYAKVTVLTPSRKNKVETSNGVTVKRFAVPSIPLSLLKPQDPRNWLKIQATLRAGKDAVHNLIQANNIDHIFALWALPSGYWAQSAARVAGIDYSIWTLGSDIWTLGKIPMVRSILSRVVKESALCYADGYILAEDTAKIGQRQCNFLPSSRTLAVPAEKSLAEKPPYKLAFLGRWHPNKGADLLVEALSLLTDEDWAQIAEIRYCGGGPLENEIVSKIKELQGQSRPVQLKGFLNQQEAIDLFMWADYLLIPSRIESIPVIFSDAMQTMTPVIVTPVGDLPYLTRKHNVGIVAESTNSTSIAKAIKESCLHSPHLFQKQLQETQLMFNTSHSAHKFFSDVQQLK